MFVIPEDVRSLSDADLNEALTAALAEAEEYADLSDAEATPDQLDRVIALGEFAEAAHAELAVRADKAKRYAAAREALAVSRTPAETPDETESLTAAAAAAADSDDPPVTRRPVMSIVAAANVPNFNQGHAFADLNEVGSALVARMQDLPRPSRGGEPFSTKYPVAQIRSGVPGLTQDTRDVTDLLLRAANEHDLPGGSLVAAGGWGSPSVRDYGLSTQADTGGLIDIPGITITRGGISYTKGVTLADVLGSATGWIDMTEAQAEAGTEKTFHTIEDPEFDDVRLDPVGFAVKAGLLLRTAYPEVIRNYVETVLIGHEHKMSAKIINKIIALIGSKTTLANGFGNAIDILHLLEMVAVGERQRYRLPENATLEVILPIWIKAVVRADLANRTGVDFLAVSDEQIVGYFASRKFRPQFVYNWQHVDLDTLGIATAYPATVQALIYPAGTYVKGTADVLSLSTLYDSTLLKTNEYVETFVEQGVLVANPSGEGRHVELPFCANGTTGAASITACFSSEPVVGS